jgi:hypothetical protein bacD2_01168
MEYESIQSLYDANIENLFLEGVVIFDTSALLDLYMYSRQTSETLLSLIQAVFGERMFLPGYVKYEFDKNRRGVIEKEVEIYKKSSNSLENIESYKNLVNIIKKIKKEIDKIPGTLENFINVHKKQDKMKSFNEETLSEVKDFYNTLKTKCDETIKDLPIVEAKIKKEINRQTTELEKMLEVDQLQDQIEDCFTIGKNYEFSKIMRIVQEGIVRYTAKIPPGYADDEKIGFHKYGDLIIWKQILEYASEEAVSVLYVSSDIKEDWNEILKGKKRNGKKPTDNRKIRHELLLEFNEVCGKELKKITLNDFIFEIWEYYQRKLDIEELDNSEITSEQLCEMVEESQIRVIRELAENTKEEYLNRIQDKILYEANEEVGSYSKPNFRQPNTEDIEITGIVLSDVVFTSERQSINVGEYDIIYNVKVYVDIDVYYWDDWTYEDTSELMEMVRNQKMVNGELTYTVIRSVAFDFEKSECTEDITSDIDLAMNNLIYRDKRWDSDIESELEDWECQ